MKKLRKELKRICKSWNVSYRYDKLRRIVYISGEKAGYISKIHVPKLVSFSVIIEGKLE